MQTGLCLCGSYATKSGFLAARPNYFFQYMKCHIISSYSHFYYTRFFVRKIGYINFIPKLVRRPSVRPSVTFLVIVSSPKPLDVATSNFLDA